MEKFSHDFFLCCDVYRGGHDVIMVAKYAEIFAHRDLTSIIQCSQTRMEWYKIISLISP
jgi:hypothetical protein